MEKKLLKTNTIKDLYLLADILRSGVLQNDLKQVSQLLETVMDKCKRLLFDGDETDVIFAQFVINGYLGRTIKNTDFKRETIVNTILFKQSKDRLVTVLAKIIYYKTGAYEREFANYQVDKILHNQEMDIMKEYEKYKNMTQYKSEG